MTIESDLDRLTNVFDEIKQRLIQDGSEFNNIIKHGILEAKDELQLRTEGRNQGLNGALKPYSRQYTARLNKKYGSAAVDFNITGTLWTSFTYHFERVRQGLTAYLFFRGGRTGTSLSNSKLAQILHKERPFFDLLDAEKKIIENAVDKAVERAFDLSSFE